MLVRQSPQSLAEGRSDEESLERESGFEQAAKGRVTVYE
jgi:hypothetical protein